MTDHDLIVSPTVRPKYSLTSQKPASLTWLKNSEPQPIARTSRARWLAVRVDASGPTMPAAVMVATVAEPVPRRIRTATSQPSSEHRDVDAGGPVLDDLADAGVDEGLLEATAGRDDEDDARDARQARTEGVAHLALRHAGARDRAAK